MKYKSIKGGSPTVNFEKAVLDGFAEDGGLYVPEQLPHFDLEQLEKWKDLSYLELAMEIIPHFIEEEILTRDELQHILKNAYQEFEKEEIIPIHKLKTKKETYIMELFHGPTLSFKDFGMAFLVNTINFFLQRKKKQLSIIVATTGDTGPAAAHYIAGKSNLNAWVLYPKGLITEAQERQMTTLPQSNVHAIGVLNCPEGGDDLDAVIKNLYANSTFKNNVNLSSVNSINWGRILMQTVHYFYGYFQVANTVGEKINISVPSGGFGNLCGGTFARMMGLPIHQFMIANNQNACLHRIFKTGLFTKAQIIETISSAIDILIPINFWRYLYFSVGKNSDQLKAWIDEFEKEGQVQFDEQSFKAYSHHFLSKSIDDVTTKTVIKDIYANENYLLDPHGAVAIAAISEISNGQKTICLATAHPAKFPKTILEIIGTPTLPKMGKHHSIEKEKPERGYTFELEHLEKTLIREMQSYWNSTKEKHHG